MGEPSGRRNQHHPRACPRIGAYSKQKGPETIADSGAGVPNHSELEPSGGVPHRLGGAAEDGGVRLVAD